MSHLLKTVSAALFMLFAFPAVHEAPAFSGMFVIGGEREPFGRTRHHVVANDEETLVELAVRNGLGYNEIVAANPGINPWYPGSGTRVLVPTSWILPELLAAESDNVNRAVENVYTVQIANYEELEGAQRDFFMLAGALPEAERGLLRLERAGEKYRLRFGKFRDYAEAKRGISVLDGFDHQPFIVRATVDPERVLASIPQTARNDRQAMKGAVILVNLAELRLYRIAKLVEGLSVTTFPIGIAREGLATPLGEYRIVEKLENPSWTVPESILMESPELPAVVPPGPDNPLGAHALRLSNTSYLIHGTNRPLGVGRKVSHGCIRMYPEDIKILHALSKVGDTVRIVSQPVKVGIKDGNPYIEVHEQDEGPVKTALHALSLLTAVGLASKVDALLLDEAVAERRGIPVPLTRKETGS